MFYAGTPYLPKYFIKINDLDVILKNTFIANDEKETNGLKLMI